MSKNKMAIKVAVSLMGAVSIGIVFFYIIFISKGYYHADCTDTITWAEAVLDGKALMNSDFYYACLLPFGGQLLMVPFVAIFGVSMTAQLCGMVLFAICFGLALAFLLRSMNFSYKWSVFGVSALFLIVSISEKLREIFWCHIIYYSLGLLFVMVGLGLLLRVLNYEKSKKKYMILLLIWTVLCSMNGIQALTIYGLPVLAAFMANIFFDVKTPFSSKKNEKKYKIILALILAIIVGILLGKIANGNIVAGYQEGYSEFSKQSQWLDNFLSFVPQWFTLFGVEAGRGTLIYSCEGIIELLKIICSLVVLIVPIIMTIMYNKFETIAYKLMILTHSFMTALILLGWVFGSLNTACWRLSPIVGTSVILCIMFAKWIYDKKQYHRMFAIIVIPIEILMIISAIGILKINNTRSESNQALENVIDTLEKNNLQYGYGTFWNANSITLLSDNDVKVRCINVNESGVSPRAYQTNINWYKDNSYKEYFLLLKADEYVTYKYSENYVEPIKEIKSDNYFILVYNYNLLENK